MQTLPLKYKLILAPAVIIIPVIFVIFLMLYYLDVIGQQNDTVRDWAHTTDQIRIAITSSEQLNTIINKIPYSHPSEMEELYFNYIEQSRVLDGTINNPVLRDKIQKETLVELNNISKILKFHEKMDIQSNSTTLALLIPQLETLYNSLQAQKRAIYIDSNEYVKNKTSTLASISASVLALCVLLGIILSLWITRSTTSRIRQLAKNANLVCELSPKDNIESKKIDDLEDIALCLSIMSNNMLSTIAAEKLLQGVEDERSRIAMDIHDQFLSDLNNFKRTLNKKISESNHTPFSDTIINEINSTFDELTFTLRGIIDDLHPQTLDMFGLKAALQSYLSRKLSTEGQPEYFINIDPAAENHLSLFQKLSLYRILLESIQNIIRHSHCSRYEIDLRLIDNSIVLTIEDNGIGMNIDDKKSSRGHGIFNITQRAYSIKAKLEWNKSRFSSGTQLLIMLPLELTNINTSVELKDNSYAHST